MNDITITAPPPNNRSVTTPPTAPGTDIHPVGPGDVAAVAATLAAAFQDDPIFSWCLPDAMRRASVLPDFFRLVIEAVLPAGESTRAADGRSAALWVPPTVSAVADPDAFGGAIAALLGADAERTFALMAMLDEIHPAEPHRFLWFVGARPEVQGQGRGSALLHHTLACSDAEGSVTYLDATSESSRRLYERHGFDVVGQHSTAGSPPMWTMRRTPTS